MDEKLKKETQEKLNKVIELLSEVDTTVQELLDEYPEDEEERTDEQNEEYDALGCFQESIQSSKDDIEGLEVP